MTDMPLLFLYCFLWVPISSEAVDILDTYHQNDYDIKPERAEIAWFNDSYFSYHKIALIFYNRTERVLNGSWCLLQDLSDELTIEVHFSKFLSNEYRYFPLDFSVDFCKRFKNNAFGIKQSLRNTSNLHDCPLEKGIYYVKNVKLDTSQFPPYMPKGAYKVQLKGFHKSNFMYEMHGFASVVAKPIKFI